MSKILSLIIQILNTFNKFIWKIIKFLSKYIEIDDINHNNNDIANIKYRRFNVDSTPPIIETFVSIEHKDYKQLIKDNNIKPVKRRNGKSITIDVSCPCCGVPKYYLYDKTCYRTCPITRFVFRKKNESGDSEYFYNY